MLPSIDSSDYKGFIFGMLFLKRLSDRFDEDCEALVAEGGDPEDKDEHQFFVPKRARWSGSEGQDHRALAGWARSDRMRGRAALATDGTLTFSRV